MAQVLETADIGIVLAEMVVRLHDLFVVCCWVLSLDFLQVGKGVGAVEKGIKPEGRLA